jgi:Holliday junction resolvase RusA-like endonuclease
MSNEEIYNVFIPVVPRTKKNNSRIIYTKGRPRPILLPSEKYLQFEKECEPYLQPLNIDYPINVKAIYHRLDRRRIDLVNLHQALMDTLVKYDVVKDDNCNRIASLDGSKVVYDKVNTGIELVITKL